LPGAYAFRLLKKTQKDPPKPARIFRLGLKLSPTAKKADSSVVVAATSTVHEILRQFQQFILPLTVGQRYKNMNYIVTTCHYIDDELVLNKKIFSLNMISDYKGKQLEEFRGMVEKMGD
jgi:hypothetical protein